MQKNLVWSGRIQDHYAIAEMAPEESRSKQYSKKLDFSKFCDVNVQSAVVFTWRYSPRLKIETKIIFTRLQFVSLMCLIELLETSFWERKKNEVNFFIWNKTT